MLSAHVQLRLFTPKESEITQSSDFLLAAHKKLPEQTPTVHPPPLIQRRNAQGTFVAQNQSLRLIALKQSNGSTVDYRN